jgi:D-aminopeptidase
VRARDVGIVVGRGQPGPNNAITDVRGVRVGHTTLIEGEGPRVVGEGPIRTGVTVLLPHDGSVWEEPSFSGCHTLNGNGELTGLEWIREAGMLTSPIALTNTHSVGVVRDALIADEIARRRADGLFWGLPVVGETWDGILNDVNGLHVKREHVGAALAAAVDGPVREGNVGGGTGMICHGFKGGIGTASRVIDTAAGGYTVGVLVQANYGRRERLRVTGIPVGELIPASEVPLPAPPAAAAPGAGTMSGPGSIIVVVATDAPLLPHQCTRLAQRAGLGVAQVGGVGEHWSGDLFLAFATGNRGMPASELGDVTEITFSVTMYSNTYITALFDAVVESTEEAIVNALLAAETMTGRDGVTAHALGPDRLLDAIGAYRRGGAEAKAP